MFIKRWDGDSESADVNFDWIRVRYQRSGSGHPYHKISVVSLTHYECNSRIGFVGVASSQTPLTNMGRRRWAVHDSGAFMMSYTNTKRRCTWKGGHSFSQFHQRSLQRLASGKKIYQAVLLEQKPLAWILPLKFHMPTTLTLSKSIQASARVYSDTAETMRFLLPDLPRDIPTGICEGKETGGQSINCVTCGIWYLSSNKLCDANEYK